MNLFLALVDDITLIVKGNGNIHVVGFYEPEPGEGMPFGDEDEDFEGE